MNTEHLLNPNYDNRIERTGGRKVCRWVQDRERLYRELHPHVEKEILLYITVLISITSFT